jgi:hypothetical protein
MKKETRFALLVLLLAILISTFADEAMARPKWLGVKLKYSAQAEGYGGKMKLSVTISNDSDDRIVTQLSEMKGSATFTARWNSGTELKDTKKFTFSDKKARKVELTPGESKTYTWTLPYTLKEGYVIYNQRWKCEKWSFDCSAKSVKEGPNNGKRREDK